MYFTIRELATALRVSPETVRRLLRLGEIRGKKIGRLWRIPEEEVERLLGSKELMELKGRKD